MQKVINKEDGSILIGDIPNKPGERARIDVIIVAEGSRRKGIGTNLIKEFETAARAVRSKDIMTMFSYTSTTPETRASLIGLFSKNGYREIGNVGLGPMFVKRLRGRHRHPRR